jgi:integrase
LLRFFFLRGDTAWDLSAAVPMVRTYRQSGVPAVLSPDEVERVLAATDRSTTRGRRDYAILLLLARLGLRAGEIVALELSDFRWRAGDIVVRGKGPRRDQVPLLADIGDAVASASARIAGQSYRRIFLRLIRRVWQRARAQSTTSSARPHARGHTPASSSGRAPVPAQPRG